MINAQQYCSSITKTQVISDNGDGSRKITDTIVYVIDAPQVTQMKTDVQKEIDDANAFRASDVTTSAQSDLDDLNLV